MRELWRRHRRLGAATLFAGFVVAYLTIQNTFGWAGHVTWSELGQFNMGQFERQLREALPVGTSSVSVEQYLQREGIPFKHVTVGTPIIWVFAPSFIRQIPFADLSVHIELDRDSKVSGIKFNRLYK